MGLFSLPEFRGALYLPVGPTARAELRKPLKCKSRFTGGRTGVNTAFFLFFFSLFFFSGVNLHQKSPSAGLLAWFNYSLGLKRGV